MFVFEFSDWYKISFILFNRAKRKQRRFKTYQTTIPKLKANKRQNRIKQKQPSSLYTTK